MKNKTKYIYCACILCACAIFVTVGGIFLKDGIDPSIPSWRSPLFLWTVIYGVSVGFIGLCRIMDFLYVRFDNNVIILSIRNFLAFVALIISIVFVALYQTIMFWLLFSAAAINFFSIVVLITNIGYKGEPIMNYGQKILEVPIQLLLLIVSAFCSYLSLLYIGILLTDSIINKWLKRDAVGHYEYKKGETIVLGGYYKQHKIRDNDGNVIGSIDGEYVQGDEEYTEEDKWIFVNDYGFPAVQGPTMFFVRLSTFLLAIVALFVPHLYVSVRSPRFVEEQDKELKYDIDNFVFHDLIIMK